MRRPQPSLPAPRVTSVTTVTAVTAVAAEPARSPRPQVPDSLKDDLEVVLERVHHLLNGLLNICMEQRFVTATMNVIECSQLFMQAIVTWP